MSSRKDETYILDILHACHQITEYVKGYSEHRWLNDSKTQDAVLRQLMIIGEGAAALSTVAKKEYNVPWRLVINFRNLAAHRYWEINWEMVWDIVKKHLPQLCKSLR